MGKTESGYIIKSDKAQAMLQVHSLTFALVDNTGTPMFDFRTNGK